MRERRETDREENELRHGRRRGDRHQRAIAAQDAP